MTVKYVTADRRLDRIAWFVVGAHAILRLAAASTTDLGIDEAYYIQYARYPDWAYFDHPPLVGWLIWLTTAALTFSSEISVRIGPLLIGTSSLYVIYRIGCVLKDRTTGVIAMVLTASSPYHSIIAGVFVLPDSTQSLFWLLALWSFLAHINQPNSSFLWLFGIAAGFAMLSKYHGVFLICAALCYFLLTNHRKLWSWRLIPILLVPLALFSPAVIWNLTHGLMSFDFHGARIGNDTMTIRPHFLLREIAGQLLYNNPLNVVWIGLGLQTLFQKRHLKANHRLTFLFCSSVPLLVTVIGLSLFNQTLPHWSGPAYYGLILATAYGMRLQWQTGKQRAVIKRLGYSIGFFVFVIMLGILQVRTGFIPMPVDPVAEKLGSRDFTLDLYGWPQLALQFDSLVAADLAAGRMDKDAVLVASNWFPAGQLDYYLGFTKHRQLLVAGTLDNRHQYHFINDVRGGFPPATDCYFLSVSRYRNHPPEILKKTHQLHGMESLTVRRLGKPVYHVYAYRFRIPEEDTTTSPTGRQ